MPCSPADVARLRPDPGQDRHIVEVPLAIVAIAHIGVVGEVGLEDLETPVEVVVAHCHAHSRLLQAVFAQGRAALEGLLA